MCIASCLTGNLRLFLIYNFELINVGKWMTFGRTMLIESRIRPLLAMFFYMITKRRGGLPNVERFVIRLGAWPLIDYILFEGWVDLVFGMHEHHTALRTTTYFIQMDLNYLLPSASVTSVSRSHSSSAADAELHPSTRCSNYNRFSPLRSPFWEVTPHVRPKYSASLKLLNFFILETLHEKYRIYLNWGTLSNRSSPRLCPGKCLKSWKWCSKLWFLTPLNSQNLLPVHQKHLEYLLISYELLSHKCSLGQHKYCRFIFLNAAPSQNLVSAPGVAIWMNTVCVSELLMFQGSITKFKGELLPYNNPITLMDINNYIRTMDEYGAEASKLNIMFYE